jgi:iron complex transport system ATP-binding protein
MSASEPVIALHDASLIRGRARVLDGVTLTVEQGQHTAILGPNGAGKSSLIRMLTLDDRPLRPANGNGRPPLQLFGRELWDVEELRHRLGVVTGDLDATFGIGTSHGRVSGFDVALSGLFGSQGIFAHHEVTDHMRQRARMALDRVDATHLADRPLNELSTGERRRLLIARALVTEPEALVLDEPTTGLDFVARHRFLESVNRLARHGTTVILVTHHVEEVIPDTKMVVLLGGGRVRYQGPPDEALTSERLSALYEWPVSVRRVGRYFEVGVG